MIISNIGQKLGNHFSWDIVDNNIALKKGDKSVFKFRCSGIPKESRWYWGAENLKKTDTINLILYFQEKKYRANIKLEERGRTRIFWFSDFDKALKQGSSYNIDENIYPTLLFKRTEKNTYLVELIDGNINFHEQRIINHIAHKNDHKLGYEQHVEGRKRYVTLNKPERNAANRKLCIEYHSLSCSVCGFNFEKVYGELGKGFIEVHHIALLSRFLEEKKVDPINDLVPLCSNCHSMIHRKRNEVLLIEDLKAIIT